MLVKRVPGVGVINNEQQKLTVTTQIYIHTTKQDLNINVREWKVCVDYQVRGLLDFWVANILGILVVHRFNDACATNGGSASNSSLFNFNTLRPRQNGRHFPDDNLKHIFLNENVWISIKISLKYVPRGPINNIPALVQIMAWRRPCDKPLSGPMMVRLPTHICVTRPQWVKEHRLIWPAIY